MSNILAELAEKKLAHPPSFISHNTAYLTVMGSHAYGTAITSENKVSDFDVYGFCIPPKSVVFPHTVGEIIGFGRQKERFEQYQEHHIFDQDALGGKGREYDFNVYGIVKYFSLLMENNPNVIDSIFTPHECVLYINQIGSMVRENRKIFLHKGAWHKFKGYAYSQLHKMKSRGVTGKRKEIREEYGFDVKFAMHTVRLLDEAEQILLDGDIDLRRNSEQLKAIRRGDVSEEDIRKWASDKEKQLEKIYTESKLQYKPDENKIKSLLLQCLEHHYGSLDKVINMPDRYESALYSIKQILIDNGIGL